MNVMGRGERKVRSWIVALDGIGREGERERVRREMRKREGVRERGRRKGESETNAAVAAVVLISFEHKTIIN